MGALMLNHVISYEAIAILIPRVLLGYFEDLLHHAHLHFLIGTRDYAIVHCLENAHTI